LSKYPFVEFEFLPQHDFGKDDYYLKLTTGMDVETVAYCKALAKAGGDHKGAVKVLKPNAQRSTIANVAPDLRKKYGSTQAARQLISYLGMLMTSYDDHQPVTLDEIVRQTERDFRNPSTDAKTRMQLSEKIMKWRGLDCDTVDKTTDLEDSEILATMEALRKKQGVPAGTN
jgi:hypothetical protein